MTSEHLLDAVGLLDDDLIQDAEVLTRSRPQVIWNQFRRLAPAAACVALILFSVQFLQTGGGSSESTGAAAPSFSNDAAASTSDATGDHESFSGTSQEVSSSVGSDPEFPEENPLGFRVLVTIDGLTYAYSHTYPPTDAHGPLVDTLPEGCLPVGAVVSIDGDITVPHTDIGIYEGCALWLEGTGEGSTLYLELPEGSYLVCEYSQTYDFSPGASD